MVLSQLFPFQEIEEEEIYLYYFLPGSETLIEPDALVEAVADLDQDDQWRLCEKGRNVDVQV